MSDRHLKLVDEAEVAGPVLPDHEPLFLSTQEMLDEYWPQVEVLLQPVVEEAMHGEMTLADIYEGIIAGRLIALIVKDDTPEVPDVALVLILELVVYPGFTALNVTALGGRELDLLRSRFWDHLCSWAYMNGVRTIQAMVSPAMARVLKRFGFEQVYTVMRLPLTEM